MDRFQITGGIPLQGKIQTGGSKNAALPAIAATLLTDKRVILESVPDVWDIGTMLRLLKHLGVAVERKGHKVTFDASDLSGQEAPYEIVKTMRASSLVLGPLVARCGFARVSIPGGCAIGARPIDLHLRGLEKLGATISQEYGYIEARADKGLKGTTVHFDRITVTGTEDLMMAAVLAKGDTVLENAAREPEVQDLALLLNNMGAKIQGAGTSEIRINGVGKLRGEAAAAAVLKEKTDEFRQRFANPYIAAERGYVDAVIQPHETRQRIMNALDMLDGKRDKNPPKKHGNIPL